MISVSYIFEISDKAKSRWKTAGKIGAGVAGAVGAGMIAYDHVKGNNTTQHKPFVSPDSSHPYVPTEEENKKPYDPKRAGRKWNTAWNRKEEDRTSASNEAEREIDNDKSIINKTTIVRKPNEALSDYKKRGGERLKTNNLYRKVLKNNEAADRLNIMKSRSSTGENINRKHSKIYKNNQ